jgi:hypothetical protein
MRAARLQDALERLSLAIRDVEAELAAMKAEHAAQMSLDAIPSIPKTSLLMPNADPFNNVLRGHNIPSRLCFESQSQKQGEERDK